ncbi:hypothetical protein CALCODRAFT_242445 [Calocera cornea HHB12733]|uniref:C2H2-type domain-containing protein n=1 Tax=Calocera cornea HHB12733 TaxID=1353952 RepID=A0A165GPS8_9BASI|nr:hypothetical protein CALCODRAFT_242445 [Calocera cornea HHB12733]
MKGCQKQFMTLAGAVLHLESGGCCSGVDRAKVDHYMFAHDTRHVVTSATARMYRCPNRACATEKLKLGAIYQHVQMGSGGANRFAKVRNVLESFVSGMGELR